MNKLIIDSPVLSLPNGFKISQKLSWWSIDGDELLMGSLNFPCPATDLAEELSHINRFMLILAVNQLPVPLGSDINPSDLDALAFRDETSSDRIFQLCWEDSDPQVAWVLVEDIASGESSSNSATADV